MIKLASLPLLFISLLLPHAFAQSSSGSININTTDLRPATENDRDQKQGTSTGKIEKIEVTGSHIRRVDVEGPSPVQTLDREYIEKTGYNSAGDILRELSANSFGSFRERSGSSTFSSGATVSLRGLGASRTLVLLNGKRLARDGAASAPDLNLIPAAAIERMDVLKDGASALYGSDALGGVINIITKQNFVGTEFDMRQELTEKSGGERRTISMTHGNTVGKVDYTTSFQYRKNEKIFSKSRAYSKEGTSNRAPTANLSINGVKQASHVCKTTFRLSDGLCNYNYANSSTELPEIEQFNNITTFNAGLGQGFEVSGMMKGTYKETIWNYAPGAHNLTGLVLDQSYAGYQNIPNYSGGAIDALWRSEALGTRDEEVKDIALGGNIALKKELFDTWEADLTLGTEDNRRKSVTVKGFARRAELMAAVNRGDIDIVNGVVNKMPDNLRYQPSNEVTSSLTFGEVRASGELFDGWAGPIGIAVGSGYAYENYSTTFDELSAAGGVAGGGAGSSGYGTRQSQFAYTEVGVPLLSNLELNLAGRVDRFSDFGTTLNPRAALKYQPMKILAFRASAGTGFKAPDLNSMHRSVSEGFESLYDARTCPDRDATSCTPEFFLISDSGNKNLTEETSKSYNLGVVVEPSRHFNISFDYYKTIIDNQVGSNYQALIDAWEQGVDISQFNSSIETSGAGDTGSISRIVTTPLNLTKTTISGLDIAIGSNFMVSRVGTFQLSNQFSYMFEYRQRALPGLPEKNLIGTKQGAKGSLPRWRNNVGVTYLPTDRWAVSTNWNMVAKHQKRDKFQGEVPQYTSMDAQVAYDAWKGATITVGAKNVLGEDPPLDRTDANNFLNDEIYDPIGRRFFASYKQRF